jgi:regulator of protease activity HflC (stomatin/prohibitin superfamily)
LQDVHPPVSVAGSYEAVIGATQKREADILKARADAVATNAWSQGEAVRKQRDAEATRVRTTMNAAARAARFTNQIPAFSAAPSVYAQLAYFQTLNGSSSGTRKIIIAATNSEDIVVLNLEEKLRRDLLELPLPAAQQPK